MSDLKICETAEKVISKKNLLFFYKTVYAPDTIIFGFQ